MDLISRYTELGGVAVALTGTGALAAALFWMRPPPLRSREGGPAVALGLGLILIPAVLRHDPATLWFVGAGCALVALPLLWMGRLPADMPSGRDPRSRAHPRYREVARRGRIAGIAIAASEIAWIVAFFVFIE